MENFIHLSGDSTLNNSMCHGSAVIPLSPRARSWCDFECKCDCKVQYNVQQQPFHSSRPPTARTPGAPVSATTLPWWVAGWLMADQTRTPLDSIHATRGQATSMKPSVSVCTLSKKTKNFFNAVLGNAHLSNMQKYYSQVTCSYTTYSQFQKARSNIFKNLVSFLRFQCDYFKNPSK